MPLLITQGIDSTLQGFIYCVFQWSYIKFEENGNPAVNECSVTIWKWFFVDLSK